MELKLAICRWDVLSEVREKVAEVYSSPTTIKERGRLNSDRSTMPRDMVISR